MSTASKILQKFAGILQLLFVVAVLFQKIYAPQRKSYAEKTQYVYQMLTKISDSTGAELTGIALLWGAVVLSCVSGVLLLVRKTNHVACVLCQLACMAAELVACLVLPSLYPQSAELHTEWIGYVHYWLSIAILAFAFVMSLLALFGKKVEQSGAIQEEFLPLEGFEDLKRKKNLPEGYAEGQVETPPEQAVVQEQIQPSGQPVASVNTVTHGTLVCQRGVFAQAQIPMTSGEILRLGRDNDNHLVFTGQPKVSRHHCTLVWLEELGKYQIKDSSSNGSFVNGNEEDPIPQNISVYLEPGTILDIGDENNRFLLM